MKHEKTYFTIDQIDTSLLLARNSSGVQVEVEVFQMSCLKIRAGWLIEASVSIDGAEELMDIAAVSQIDHVTACLCALFEQNQDLFR